MRIWKLFRKMRFGFFALFAAIILSTSILSITTVSRELSAEYESSSRSIAKSIADSSVDILLNRNLATLQSLIDQFVEIESIRYIYIISDTGEFLAHTFVPGIPQEVLESDPLAMGPIERSLPGLGDFVEVGSPILSGVAGTVHVGMDLELLALKTQRVVGQQIYLLCITLIVGTLISIWLVRLASKPLEDLTAYAIGLAHDQGRDDNPGAEVLSRDDEAGDIARLMQHVAGGAGNPPEKLKVSPGDDQAG